VLRKNFFSSDEIDGIVKDFRNAGLPDEEVAVMSLAQKVVTGAHEIDAQEIDALRGYGLEDEEIFDVILAAAARSFFAQTLDATGVQPDKAYLETVGDLISTLSVGRNYDSEQG
jgi:alkylhydroperoxidase family enzyme